MGAILSISSPNNIFEWMAFLAEKYSSMFLQGTWITLYVSVIGTIVGFILGYIVGIVGDIKIHKEIIRSKRELSNSSNLSVSYM